MQKPKQVEVRNPALTSLEPPLAPVAQAGEEPPKRLMVVTDAWEPQVNGVVRTLSRVLQEVRAMGVEVEICSPADGYKTVPLPTYSEIRLAVGARKNLEERFKAFAPDAVHIATEGPLGVAMRAICKEYKYPFTTSYHTRFPEYVSARLPLPLSAGYAYMRWFHGASGRVMVATSSLREELLERGLKNLAPWSRGVDVEQFSPLLRGKDGGVYGDLPRPVFVCVGRVAVEKNLEAFLGLELPGSKVVVGDGPQRGELEARYPGVRFTGARFGEELARHYADADVFVFPSLTDTFGLVILEALACGTPVAAFDAPGPKDILPGSGAGAALPDLREACMIALEASREAARAHAERYSWRACAEEFVRNLTPLPKPEKKRFWRRLRLRGILRRRRRNAMAGF